MIGKTSHNKLRRSKKDTLFRLWRQQQRNGPRIFSFKADHSQGCCVGLPLKKAHPKRLKTRVTSTGFQLSYMSAFLEKTKAGDKESEEIPDL